MKLFLYCLLLLLLFGCTEEKVTACSRFFNEHEVLLNITSHFDTIQTIDVTQILVLPYELLASEEKMKSLYEQIDDSCHIEENMLIKEYRILPEETCSLRKTIENLRERRYYCE